MKPFFGKAILVVLCVGVLVYAIGNSCQTVREWESWERDTTTLFTAIDVERTVKAREQVWRDSVEGVTDSLLGVADRSDIRGRHFRAQADSLRALLQTATSPTDSLGFALQRIESLEGSLGEDHAQTASLRSILAAQAMVLARLRASEQRAWRLIDSASAVIRRVPGPCRIVGIPCPVIAIGYGVTPHGLEPWVGIAVPLR